jgi:hypothetical protein
MLAESEALGCEEVGAVCDVAGQGLGPTCGRIINEVIRTNVERDPESFFSSNFVPRPEIRTMGDFLAFAGVVGRPF